MLDQNTDRMWYVIGAVLIGAVIIFGMNTLMPNAFASVGGMMASLTDIAGENVASIDIDPLIADGYIPVATADELDKLRENKKQTFGAGTKWESEYVSGLDMKYVQVADIDLSHFDNWEPIGSVPSRFSGDYNGMGYLITDLKVDQENDYAGLFGRAEGATFKNIRLENVEITGRNYVGGLVGSQSESNISGSSVVGAVSGGHFVGGLVGNQTRSSFVLESYTDTVVKGVKNVGGIVGHQSGILSDPLIPSETHNSYAMGSVLGESYVGGLIGWNYYGTVSNTAVTKSGWAIDTNHGVRGIGAGYSRYSADDLSGFTRTEIEEIIKNLF